MQLDKEQAIMVREPDATMQLTPQDNQLMSKHRILSFKPQLRLEWRGQDGQNETEQPNHSANLGDSITPSTRTRFSVHTAVIEVVEQLGSEILLDMKVGEGAMVASVEPTVRVKVRDKLRIAVRPSRLHVFDAKTEAAI